MTEAALNDSPGETGWTVEAHLLASSSDWTQVGAIASGNWKKKAPDFKPVERPFGGNKKKAKAKTPHTSVADWHRILQQNNAQRPG